MSLVNDMLNDLDERHNQSARKAVNVDWLTGQKRANAHFSNRQWLLATVLLVIVILAAVGVKLFHDGDALVADEPVPVVPTESLAESVPMLTRQTIAGLTFSRQQTVTVVNFEYSDDIEFRVIREPAGLQIIFFDALQAIDPATLTVLPPIKSLSTQNQSNVALITLAIEGDFNYSKQALPGQGLQLLINSVVEKLPVAPQRQAAKTTARVPKPQQPVKSSTDNQLKKTLPVNLKQQDLQVAKNARRLIAANQLAQAEQVLHAMLQKKPLALHSGEMLATLLLAEQRIEEADILLTRLRGEYPVHIGLIAIKARLLLLRSDAAAAVDLLMTARPSVQLEPGYYELLGLAARQNQQYLLSEQAYKGLLNTDASQGDWWVGLAIALDAQGELPKARNAYQQALKTVRISPALEAYARQRLAQ